MRAASILLVCLPAACGNGKMHGDDVADADADTDGDADTDSDSDTGTGSGDCNGYTCDAAYGEACCPDPYGYGKGYPGCTDITYDDYNCGGCGVVCDENADRVCYDSTCQCFADECDGVCVYFDTDPQHCGDCDTVCPVEAAACSGGACVPCEDVGAVLCGGACVDVASDNHDCGACGVRCRDRTVCAQGACVAGTCDVRCHDAICCDHPYGSDTPGCTDPRGDAQNCGACDAPCPAGQFCFNGVCGG
jgi:hypothetical protein